MFAEERMWNVMLEFADVSVHDKDTVAEDRIKLVAKDRDTALDKARQVANPNGHFFIFQISICHFGEHIMNKEC